MDNTLLPAPELTRVEAITQAIAAAVFFGVGVAAWIRAPRDARTRLFLAYALVSLGALVLPVFAWATGRTKMELLPGWFMAAILVSLGVGSIVLFHFTQVFPLRRPWIRSSGIQLPALYVLTPAVFAVLIAIAPKTLAEVTGTFVGAMLVFGFPLLVLLGFVLPVAGIVSLVRSYAECPSNGAPQMRRPLFLLLVSQIAGGVLALVFAPVLAVIAPGEALKTFMTVLIWACGLLTPIAFALAVWQYGLPEE